ncbi:MAG TPA: NapC/NirT family cytochrome c [Verrucomicrobiae bacterium]|nr:NapC/NirT family cytochrome c [Verrucomicrobiae bacterium]
MRWHQHCYPSAQPKNCPNIVDDSEQHAPIPPRTPSLIENWISLFGIILAASSFFAVVCLIAMDFYAGFSNPYMGILTYIVAPSFLSGGLLLILAGVLLERRRRRRLTPGEIPRHPRIDFNIPRQRNVFLIVVVVTFVFLMFTALGSYRTYEFTESVQFCGQTCHTVMKPEFTAYQHSAHARVTCVQCHIGAGATWFVKSKLSGSYQVYATLVNKYPHPIPTPVKNLRPAQETCEQCHWPQKFYGAVERVRTHFMSDEKNSPWTIQMLLKVGGGDPTHGPVGGIHWHMNVANKVEYIASDEARQVIPWVRITDREGHVTVYESKDSPLKPSQIVPEAMRRMDCVDCHNRPTHVFLSPDESVDTSMALGRIDPSLSSIKKNAVDVLAADYSTTDEAVEKIADTLSKKYASSDHVIVQRAIAEVQKIYRENYFPEMKSRWKMYPNNIGHLQWPGCFRCHDDQHTSADGKKISANCNSCHTIIAQGSGTELTTVSAQGLEFQHPAPDIGDSWKGMKCSDCHNGGPM